MAWRPRGGNTCARRILSGCFAPVRRVPGGYGGWHAASTLAALIPLAFPRPFSRKCPLRLSCHKLAVLLDLSGRSAEI